MTFEILKLVIEHLDFWYSFLVSNQIHQFEKIYVLSLKPTNKETNKQKNEKKQTNKQTNMQTKHLLVTFLG